MKRLILSLLVIACVVATGAVASKVKNTAPVVKSTSVFKPSTSRSLRTSQTRSQSNIVSCTRSSSGYKYAGLIHTETANPAFTTQTQTNNVNAYYAPLGVNGIGEHYLNWYGISTFAVGGTLISWVQAGFWLGYDPWGDILTANYPVGTWTNATHPYDGHVGGNRGSSGNGPLYTPSGSFVDWRYSESESSGINYKISFIGVQPLGSGLTLTLQNNGNHVFSMVDQDGHPYGGVGGAADHISIPALTQNGDAANPGYQVYDGFESYDPTSGNCGWMTSHSNIVWANVGGIFYWNGYLGCSGNWNGENPADPTCWGGLASDEAPYDVKVQNPCTGTCATTVYFYLYEANGQPF